MLRLIPAMETSKRLDEYVALWQKLEETRRQFREEGKLFCIRRVMQAWLGSQATDDLIWEVCFLAEQCGYDPLPLPALFPLPHRAFLRAFLVVTVFRRQSSSQLQTGRKKCGREVIMRLLDMAYSLAFPQSPPIRRYKK